MRKLLKSIVVVALVLPIAALAQTTIRNSRHDFSSSSATTGSKQNVTDQLCYFCHVPHNAQTTLALWNHAPTAATNGWGAGNVTSAGTTLPTAIAAPSQRCMACHDGTVSIGDTLNTDFLTGWSASGVAGSVSTGGLLQTNSLGYIRATNGTLDTNHPVSVPYGSTATYNSIASRASAADYVTAICRRPLGALPDGHAGRRRGPASPDGGRAIAGRRFRPGGTHREWCDPDVLGTIRRRSLAKVRREIEPVEASVLARTLTVLQGVARPRPGLDALLDAVSSCRVPRSPRRFSSARCCRLASTDSSPRT